MQNQQAQGIIRLKIPLTVKNKGKKTNEQSFGHLQNFFSNHHNTRERNNSHKQQPLKAPPTPNLQFIKQNKMRQNAQQNSNPHFQNNNKLNIQKSLNDFDELQQDHINGQNKITCPSHPTKKAKYFLASNTNIRFCTKCAITMAQRQPILDEERFHKINEIQKFRQTVKIVKQMINQKQIQFKQEVQSLDNIFQNALNAINSQFESVFQLLKLKHEQIINYIQTKNKEHQNNYTNYGDLLTNTQNTMDKYLFDVNRNYQDIVQDLSTTNFNQIMQQYQVKITDYLKKLQNTPECIIEIEDYKSMIQYIKSLVIGISLDKQKRKSKLNERKENLSSNINIKHKGSKTPDRSVK